MGNMLRANGRGVVLEVSLTSVKIELTKAQLHKIRNHSSSVKVDQELVMLAVAHAYRSQEYRAGDIFRRTTFGAGGVERTVALVGPTEVFLNLQPLLIV